MTTTLESTVAQTGAPPVPKGYHYPSDKELQQMTPGERHDATRWVPGRSIFMNMDPATMQELATTAGAPYEPPKQAAQRDARYTGCNR